MHQDIFFTLIDHYFYLGLLHSVYGSKKLVLSGIFVCVIFQIVRC